MNARFITMYRSCTVHNMKVPFTPAHAAAVLPLRRLPLIPSALVVGSLAPDFEYFLRLSPNGSFGHTIRGAFVLTLPLAMIVLWIFHQFVKIPLITLLPDGIQRRLATDLNRFRFAGVRRFLLIVCSLLVGIATHLLWDSFTHRNTWLYHHWRTLAETIRLPIVGWVPYYKVFQHGSTVVGVGVLLALLIRWYQNSLPSCQPLAVSHSATRKMAIMAVLTSTAIVGAVLRAFSSNGIALGGLAFPRFVGQAVATAIALLWWQMVAYGLFFSLPSARR